MKKTIIITAFLCGSISLSAQFKFGVRTGVNISTLSACENVENGISFKGDGAKAISGLLLGGTVNYSLNDFWGIQTELLYSQQGGDYNAFIDGKVSHTFFNIPLLAEIKPIKSRPFSILVGPQVGLLSSTGRYIGRYDGSHYFVEYNSHIDWSIVLGVQYGFVENLKLGIRYTYGLSPMLNKKEYIHHIYKSEDDGTMTITNTINGTVTGERNKVFQISLDWTF